MFLATIVREQHYICNVKTLGQLPKRSFVYLTAYKSNHFFNILSVICSNCFTDTEMGKYNKPPT